jgi:enoyl-CoA hydratase
MVGGRPAWVGVLFAHGDHFTAGLVLAQIAGWITSGEPAYDVRDAIDPWGLVGRRRSKPLVAAVQGWCLTLGIELLLAADIRIASASTRGSRKWR